MALLLQFQETPVRKGTWSIEEDQKLISYIKNYGIWNWNEMPKAAGLSRTGKSCRLRWMNYLRPNLKHGNFTKEEDEIILKLHKKHGNRWATIAANLPGRTDNEIKNHFNTRLWKIAEKGQVKRHKGQASPVESNQEYHVSEQINIASGSPISLEPSTSHNYSLSTEFNIPSTGNGEENNPALEEKETGYKNDLFASSSSPSLSGGESPISQFSQQLSVESLYLCENENVGSIYTFTDRDYGSEECFYLQDGAIPGDDDTENYFWFDLFNHGSSFPQDPSM